MSKRRVSYYYDSDVGNYTFAPYHPMRPHRMRITHDLVTAYGMLDKMHVTRPTRATPSEMTAFHTDEYIKFIHNVVPMEEQTDQMKQNTWRFLGANDDNPPFEGVFEFCSISAGGSIAAAKRLNDGAADIAINWAGGLHHAKKREASGFCYVNDIVLGILELLRTFPRVLYIDIDCHHGDGVEEAFYTTDRVFTCSFHKFGEYFPGTGTLDDRGMGQGRGYSANIPLKDGLTDDAFRGIFEPIIARVMEKYRPAAVVLQCGADSLAGDKLGCFNVSMRGHASCVEFCRAFNVPLVLLGGGGYTVKNVALTWTFETACALGIQNVIDDHLPWCEYFEWFGPRYRLDVPQNNMEDLNVKGGSIDKVRATILQHLQELPQAPSVALQDVPREGLDVHLGFQYEEDVTKRKRPDDDDGELERDELDDQIAQYTKYLYQRDADSPRSSPSPPRWRTTKWERDARNVTPEFSSDSDVESLYADARFDAPPPPTSRNARARRVQLPGRFFYKERPAPSGSSLGLELEPSTSQLRGDREDRDRERERERERENGSDADEEDDESEYAYGYAGRLARARPVRRALPTGPTAKRRFFETPAGVHAHSSLGMNMGLGVGMGMGMGMGFGLRSLRDVDESALPQWNLDARVEKVLAAHQHQGSVLGAGLGLGMYGLGFANGGVVRRGHDPLDGEDMEVDVEEG